MSALEAIYASIPEVKGCRTGCADCCGPVPVAPVEAARIASPMLLQDSPLGKLTPTRLGCLSCAFSTPDGCSVYGSRPLMCRLFGAVDHPHLTCPHGAKADRPLTHEQAGALIQRLAALSPSPPAASDAPPSASAQPARGEEAVAGPGEGE